MQSLIGDRHSHTMVSVCSGFTPSWYTSSNWGLDARYGMWAPTFHPPDHSTTPTSSTTKHHNTKRVHASDTYPILGLVFGGKGGVFCDTHTWVVDLKPFVVNSLRLKRSTASTQLPSMQPHLSSQPPSTSTQSLSPTHHNRDINLTATGAPPKVELRVNGCSTRETLDGQVVSHSTHVALKHMNAKLIRESEKAFMDMRREISDLHNQIAEERKR